ncbi:hypothetical protein Agabi119p4_4492 [Agaricus bisporus var. burnettii]|uniref:Rab proteins geranylgeranyltransferase n=1 Tax=Agaricus bisporus var. burnettii TaxID=192524 RepID=A0A8H7KH00_AGABI|nr:hypothetical protein Agabi119p4_4492 [Agaricus bisporus var. burnettii]
MEDTPFDVIILGTGLTESVVAAALSKWGFKVAHVDENSYYGGNEASLTLDEFVEWIDTPPPHSSKISRASRSSEVPPFARQYSICLCPTIIPSTGPFIDALVQSGVSKYSSFRLLERIAVYDGSGGLKNVPGSKEDVFKNQDISLIQKRRLMRFLTFAIGDFEQSSELQDKHDLPFTVFLETVFHLDKELVDVITYALAYSNKEADSISTILHRIRRYLRSAGRYGPSPFLVGHYGGIGEITQGFCRAAAVNGAVYILGKKIISINAAETLNQSINEESPESDLSKNHPQYSVTLEDIPGPLRTDVIIGTNPYVSNQFLSRRQYSPLSSDLKAAYKANPIARCIAIIESPISMSFPSKVGEDDNEDSEQEENARNTNGKVDTAVLVLPQGSVSGGSSKFSAVALMTGEGTLSTPKGKYILYIALPVETDAAVDPSQILQPYIDILLKLGREVAQEPIFTAFYIENAGETSPHAVGDPQHNVHGSWFIPPPVPLEPLGDIADIATRNAENIFRNLLDILDNDGEHSHRVNTLNGGIWPQLIDLEEEEV